MPELEVLYTDAHLLVVNKPADMLTQPNGIEQNSLEDIAKAWVKEKYAKPGNVFLSPIHRLDKPVSGVVVFARTSKALSRGNAALREKKCKKKYLALVEGTFTTLQGTLVHTLTHDHFHASLAENEAEGKQAILHYTVNKQEGQFTWLEIDLETGRYHQIRAQLSLAGHPIVGDTKYGSKSHFPYAGIALHHYQMQLTHPTTKQELTFQAPCNFFHHRATEKTR